MSGLPPLILRPRWSSDFLGWCQLIAKLSFASCLPIVVLGMCCVLAHAEFANPVSTESITSQLRHYGAKQMPPERTAGSRTRMEGMLTGKTELHFKQFSLGCK